MKTRALAVNNSTKEEKIVTAFEAIYLREFSNNKFKNYKFYYTDDIKRRYEMHPKFISGKNTAFFAFKSDNKPSFHIDDEGESLTHYVAKKALARLKVLHLIDVKANKELHLKVIKGENEKYFDFGKPYYADVHFQLDKNQSNDMKKYFYKWDQQLAVEIFVSHKVTTEKAIAFADNNVAIFEVKIPKHTRDKFGLDSCTELTKEKIDTAVNNMERMFEKGIRGVFVSDPETEDYKIMCKYKEEIEKFKTARDNAEKEYITAQNRLEEIRKQLKEAEIKKDYYDNRVAQLEKIIETNKQHPIKFAFSSIKNRNK